MNYGGGNIAGCFEVKVRADTAKFTNVIVARLRKCSDLIREGKVQIHPLGASGHMGEIIIIILKYNVFVPFYLFIPFFLRLAYRSDRLMDFYAR